MDSLCGMRRMPPSSGRTTATVAGCAGPMTAGRVAWTGGGTAGAGAAFGGTWGRPGTVARSGLLAIADSVAWTPGTGTSVLPAAMTSTTSRTNAAATEATMIMRRLGHAATSANALVTACANDGLSFAAIVSTAGEAVTGGDVGADPCAIGACAKADEGDSVGSSRKHTGTLFGAWQCGQANC